MVARGGEVGEVDEGGQKVQISSYQVYKFWGLMYSMMIMVNNTILYTWKLLREHVLKVLTPLTPEKGSVSDGCVN